jgi:exopolyphosphatase/guanosine-5'-triphosphate,3'-diphosphate pyrophosphatase
MVAGLAGIGGTVRNLAAAAQLAAEPAVLRRAGLRARRATALDALIERARRAAASERGEVPGIKPERGDLILAGALVIQTVMEVGGFDALEAREAGLREGVFFEALLDERDPPLFDDVRRAR